MELIPLSALNHFLYRPRRAALIHVEGVFEENRHTIQGELVREHADLPGYEVAKGVKLLRALPVWSERLGLSGKCDVVEVHPGPAGGGSGPGDGGGADALVPVEYKKGRRRAFENDDAQLCAQALCLEEMLGRRIERGAIFHAASKRRREVEFTPELRHRTEAAITELHALLDPRSSILNPRLPAAVFKPACEECSLFEICLPRAAGGETRARRLGRELFQI